MLALRNVKDMMLIIAKDVDKHAVGVLKNAEEWLAKYTAIHFHFSHRCRFGYIRGLTWTVLLSVFS